MKNIEVVPYDPALNEQIGSVFLLNGTNRRFPYYHGVSPVTTKRVSITFRTVIFEK